MLSFKLIGPIILLVSLWLTYCIVNRLALAKTSKSALVAQPVKRGKALYIYVFLIIIILVNFFIIIVTNVVNEIHDYAVLPKYQATVVDYHKYISTSTHGHHTVRTLMYQPIVEFTDEHGQRIVIYSDISSSSPNVIGSQLTVAYQHGMKEAEEYSARAKLMLLALSFFAIILAYILSIAICYAWGGNINPILKFGFFVFYYFIAPLAMVFFLYAIGNILYHYIARFTMHANPLNDNGYQADLPWYFVVLLAIFFIGLLFGLLGYLISMIKRNKKA